MGFGSERRFSWTARLGTQSSSRWIVPGSKWRERRHLPGPRTILTQRLPTSNAFWRSGALARLSGCSTKGGWAMGPFRQTQLDHAAVGTIGCHRVGHIQEPDAFPDFRNLAVAFRDIDQL